MEGKLNLWAEIISNNHRDRDAIDEEIFPSCSKYVSDRKVILGL